MVFFYYIVLGIGLSIDSFTASVSRGVCATELNKKQILKIALFMSFFQALMPIVGWALGVGFQLYIESYDHWVAFILLGGLGLNMIYSSFKSEGDIIDYNPSNTKMLLGLAIATSIDAMAVGVSFGLLNISIIIPVFIIGVITFIFSFSGAWFGYKLGNKYNSKLQVFAGLVLIGIGTKILIEHTCL